MQLSNIFEIPVELRQRAMRIVNEIHHNASAYTSWKGQRLQHDREIVSVPLMGDKYRLLFRFVGLNLLTFCGACTHQTYDKIIRAPNSGSIKPMRAIMDERLEKLSASQPETQEPERHQPQLTLVQREQEPQPAEEQPAEQARAERKPRNSDAGRLIRDAVMVIEVGEEFVPFLFCEKLDVSDTAVSKVMADLTRDGIVRLVGREGTRAKYERLAQTEAEISTADLLARIHRDLATLTSRITPAVSIESFSDDDIAMETLRRMAARKAA